ncbi:MAG: DUF4340 domain-containing protein [Thiohalospira sp.]
MKILKVGHTKKTILILFSLLVIAAIYFFSNSKGTLNRRNTHFAVESTNQIKKIIISASDEKLLLIKENEQWKINNKYIARQSVVDNFLMALNMLQVSSPLSNNEKEEVAKMLEREGIQVEIFKKNRRLRNYYVSTPAMTNDKTYMMMVKRGEPFAIRIPAFKGLVAELFSTNEELWRDKTIFDYKPQNIKTISIEYPGQPSKSFELINFGDGTFALKNPNENSFVEDFNLEKSIRYFTYFQGIKFERIENEMSQQRSDSLLNSEPYCRITVTDMENYENSITIFRKPAEQEYDEFGNKIKYDYDRAYAFFNQNNELIIIQYYIFDPLLKEIDYFR